MRLPPKIKIPEFQKFNGTKDPQPHLCHYHEKMLQYWEYEQLVIATFQESLIRPALNWFMSLRVEDIPTWVDLSKKFFEQYQYNLKMPPSFLELSTMEMAKGHNFKAYSTHWRSEGKQVDLGIKLGRIEDPFKKKEGDLQRRPLLGHPRLAGPQQYSMSFTTTLSTAPTYAPPPVHYQSQISKPDLHYEYHQGAPSHTTDNCWKLRDKIQDMINKNEISFNAVKPQNVQNNPLSDHVLSSGPAINLIDVYAQGMDEDKEEEPTSP
ncbi:hypothetical protein CRG98_017858 [Punica granatum]|uniref:Retrotransposon gag domain-containing protein n=1 Tax=Punica granatum TaxID=22663 RepID=A0A2I0K227_PUNGR|nr:hypothetical protein CRG98_017858 [Punica granatum]